MKRSVLYIKLYIYHYLAQKITASTATKLY